MINTFPTEGNLSGLSRKDFQKDINDKKNRFVYPQKQERNGSCRNKLRMRHSIYHGSG